MSGTGLMERVQAASAYIADKYALDGGVYCQSLYDQTEVTEVAKDTDNVYHVAFRVYTDSFLRNSMDMVHGGASSTIVAIFTQLALAVDSKYFQDGITESELKKFAEDLGVTRAMDVQILQAVPLNTYVCVKVRVLSNTKSNAYATAAIYSESGRLLVTATHDFMKSSPHSRL